MHNSEVSSLSKLLYDAIFIPPGCERPPFDIIKDPEIYVYIRDFGREGDLCLVAEHNSEIIGAVWSRYFSEDEKGFGFIDTETPELSMSVNEKYRGKGIGTRLLAEMIKLLREKDTPQVSLSVDKINYAYSMYKKSGFEDYEFHNDSITMILKLR